MKLWRPKLFVIITPPCLESHYSISHPAHITIMQTEAAGGLTYYTAECIMYYWPLWQMFLPSSLRRMFSCLLLQFWNSTKKCLQQQWISISSIEIDTTVLIFSIKGVSNIYCNCFAICSFSPTSRKTLSDMFSICEQTQTTYFLVFPRTVCG